MFSIKFWLQVIFISIILFLEQYYSTLRFFSIYFHIISIFNACFIIQDYFFMCNKIFIFLGYAFHFMKELELKKSQGYRVL
jgi:hypothetical protein